MYKPRDTTETQDAAGNSTRYASNPVQLHAEDAVSATPETQPETNGLFRDEPRRLPREVLMLGACALVFAAVLRFIHISYRELFEFEFFTIDFITKPRPDVLPALLNGYMPVYYEFFS